LNQDFGSFKMLSLNENKEEEDIKRKFPPNLEEKEL
jgi:hypothetical protein